MTWKTVVFDPQTASAADWDRLLDYFDERHMEVGLPVPKPTREVRTAYLRAPTPGTTGRIVAAPFGGRIVGLLTLERALTGPWLRAHAGVLRGYRRRGLGTEWLRLAQREAEEAGAATLVGRSAEPDGWKFLENRGFRVAKRDGVNWLERADLDEARLDRWVRSLDESTSEVRLEVHPVRIPGERFDEYVRLCGALFAAVPGVDPDLVRRNSDPDEVGERVRREFAQGSHHVVVLAREPDGTASGLTEATWRPGSAWCAYQGITGVLPRYRGRGIGKALKATLLRTLLRRHPEVRAVWTVNTVTNAPILAINERLGFRTRAEIVEYRISTDDLAGASPARVTRRCAGPGPEADTPD